MGQAYRLAGIPRLEFQHLLASRQIPVHYDVADLLADLGTLRSPRHHNSNKNVTRSVLLA